ncbi:MAG: yaeT [Deltaproteobacteria bacterium]|nr:yaeT [Deltaproteobacteria bacterium]
MSKSVFFLAAILSLSLFTYIAWAEDTIVKITIKGNKTIEADAIKAVIKISEGKPLITEDVRDAIKAIFEMGYFTDVQAETSDTEVGKELAFIVSERPQIREIDFNGNKEIEKDKLKELLTFKANTILDLNKIRESISKIKTEYENSGYYVADVQYKIETVGENQIKLVFEINENDKVLVKRIILLGNKEYNDDALKKIIQTKEGSWSSWISSKGTFKENMLRGDVEILSSHYLNNGYIQASVEEPQVFLTPDKRWIYITIRIEEGKKFWLGKIDFKGDILDSVDDLSKNVKLKEGDVFSRDRLRQDIVSLTDMYGDKGYAFANIVPLTTLDHEKRIVNITFDISKGELVYFERIFITGNIKTRDKVIRRELKVAEGELYHGTRLKKSRQKVNNLGFFDEVNLSTERGSSPNKLNLIIDIKERPTGTLSVGAGYSSIDSFVMMGSVSQGNLFGRGQKLQLSAEYGGKRKTYNLGFTEPRLLDTEISAGFDIYNLEKQYTDFTKKSNGGDIRLGFPLGFEETRGYLTYRYEESEIFDISTSAGTYITDQAGRNTLSSVTASIVRDTRDSYLAPMSGSNNSVSTEVAGSYFGGTRSFVKHLGNSSWFYPVFWDTSVMLHGAIGYAEGTEGKALPIDERFFVGGMNTVRGFDPRSLGPKDENGIVIGGNKELIFNVEYLFPLAKEAGLRGVIFYDAGNAFGDNEVYDIENLRTSAGYGVRWYSPIGPLRLEWGYNLNPRDGEKLSRWEFSIGTFF